MSKNKIDITFCPQKNYVLVCIAGLLMLEEIVNTFKLVVTSKKFKHGMGRIWDLSQADLSELSMDKVRLASDIPEEYSQVVKASRVALVSNRAINESILKLYKIYSSEKGMEVEVFDTLKDAMTWI